MEGRERERERERVGGEDVYAILNACMHACMHAWVDTRNSNILNY